MKDSPCTAVLFVSLLVLFGVELATGAIGDDARLLGLGALSDAQGTGGEPWRLLTYAWLHSGWLHLVPNAALLWWVGRLVERRVGGVAMLGVYLACALSGGLAIAWRASLEPKPGTSLGASGAIFGLLTCALVLIHRPSAARFAQADWVPRLLWGILVGGLATSFLTGVSLAGHAGGAVLGALLGFVVPVRGLPAGAQELAG